MSSGVRVWNASGPPSWRGGVPSPVPPPRLSPSPAERPRQDIVAVPQKPGSQLSQQRKHRVSSPLLGHGPVSSDPQNSPWPLEVLGVFRGHAVPHGEAPMNRSGATLSTVEEAKCLSTDFSSGGLTFTVELPCARHCPERWVSPPVLRTAPMCMTVHTLPMGKLGTEGLGLPGGHSASEQRNRFKLRGSFLTTRRAVSQGHRSTCF